MMTVGGDTTRIGGIDVSPEGGGDFQGSGGDVRSSTTNNKADNVARREIINYYQQK